jgi:hypothetical protein
VRYRICFSWHQTEGTYDMMLIPRYMPDEEAPLGVEPRLECRREGEWEAEAISRAFYPDLWRGLR